MPDSRPAAIVSGEIVAITQRNGKINRREKERQDKESGGHGMGDCLKQPRNGVIIASLRIFRDVIITRSRLRLSLGLRYESVKHVGAKWRRRKKPATNERNIRDRENLIRALEFLSRSALS